MAGPWTVTLAVAALLLAGCSASRGPEPAPSPSLAPTTSAATAPPAELASPTSGLRPCLGPWSGSGEVHTYVLAAVDDPDTVPEVQVTEEGVHVAVWLNATPPHEGLAQFKPRDGGAGSALPGDGSVSVNLTGDPAYGEGDLPPGSYGFNFNPDTTRPVEDIPWSVSIREIPRADAPQCR